MDFSTIEDVIPYLKNIPANGSLIEFGVYNGNALSRLVKGAESVGNPFKDIYGADSFLGLPALAEREGNPDWREKSFSVLLDHNLSSIEEAKTLICERVGRNDINFIEGWFENSLTEELGEKLAGQITCINVDCDLYSSSMTVLEWAFKHKVLQPDGIIRYDDFSYGYHQGKGQALAHRLMTLRYGMEFTPLSDNVFILDGYSI